jgi:pentatricopeptide repeat protein
MQRMTLKKHWSMCGRGGAGARKKEYIENEAGNFWLLIETRPYMRALFSLAENHRAAGDMDEAFRVYQEMLRLNPADNQGVRDIIAQCFAEADRDDPGKIRR